jgi:hypothetical protein
VNLLFAAAAGLQRLLSAQGWKSSIIGGLAVQRWGEPRQTRDVDVALLTGFGGEARFIDHLLEHYQPRRADARQFALDHRVLLVETDTGVPFDISLAALPFEERVVSRSTEFEFAPGANLNTCSAEDLVVLKAFADRPQDWLDVEGIIVRQGRALDRAQVMDELMPLLELKEDLSPSATLEKLFRKHPQSRD